MTDDEIMEQAEALAATLVPSVFRHSSTAIIAAALKDMRRKTLKEACSATCEGCRLAPKVTRDRHGHLWHEEPMPIRCTAAAIRALDEGE